MSNPSSTNTFPELIRVQRPLVVGRGQAADVRLPHPAVSRRHAQLFPDNGRIIVRDAGSRGGVLVNGVAVTDARLGEDDVVAFGSVAYEVKGGALRRVTHTEGVRLEARDLGFRRGDRAVLTAVNLIIPPNSFVGILGPSGAGKTTLLKGLTGNLPPSAGRVIFDGIDMERHREICREMAGFVPQDDVVYGSLTTRENLDYALRLRVSDDLRPSERTAWIQHIIERLGLEKHADRVVRTLSGGQRKRVSVAIELLTRPRLLFLDEPTAGLDPASEARLMQFFRDLSRRGTTVVCTTHVLESLDQFDAVLVVAGGRLLGSGRPQNLLSHFQAKNFAALYEQLESPPPPPPRAPGAGPALPPPVAANAQALRPSHKRAGTRHQSVTQLLRGMLLIARDPTFLALLVGQPLLIGFLITLSQINPGVNELNLLYTFTVVAAIWLGLNNTAREVVRDRSFYARERRAVINPESYLISKILLYAAIGFVQIVLLVLWIRYCNFLDKEVADQAYRAMKDLSVPKFLAVMWVTYLSAMFLGLLISSLAPTEEVAVAILPLVVLPQLLLSGTASGLFLKEGGWFNSPDVLLHTATRSNHHGFADWLLELTSLFTFSRPALAFFLTFDPRDKSPLGSVGAAMVKWAYLLFMTVATATVFVFVFLRRERRWLERI